MVASGDPEGHARPTTPIRCECGLVNTPGADTCRRCGRPLTAPDAPEPARKRLYAGAVVFLVLALGIYVLQFGIAEGPPQTVTGQLADCTVVLQRGLTTTLELSLHSPPMAIRYQVDGGDLGAIQAACGRHATMKIGYTSKGSLTGTHR